MTTNFDRIFERVARRDKLQINACPAPMLPIPKNSRWNGLVYLHGLLPEDGDESALHRLVLTSGDFGLAYLTERWAARFVGELFRNYVVCFVGYSINDPVLRYMMDALAADRMLGEVIPQGYALADCTPGQEAAKTIEWKAKGVSPILYEVPARSNDHSALHRTLKEWAETYRDGILGKERIVVEYALARPSASTAQDEFVGRMLWALSDATGLPAKRFAESNPVPALEWLEALSDERYRHEDLDHFGVSSRMHVHHKLRFSLIRRPAPFTHAPWMSPVSGGATSSQWDAVMFQLARWLVRHLNDPTVIIWLAGQGGQLHDRFARLIERELDRLASVEQEGKTTEQAELRANALDAIPQPMQVLWRLLLTGRVKSWWHDVSLHRWKDRLKRNALTTTLRLQLRELLAPKVALEKPLRWGASDEEGASPVRLEQLVHWELVLATEHVGSSLQELSKVAHWQSALPSLVEDFQQLLRDALDLLGELGEADEHGDRSHWELPSITPHRQNRGFHDWVVLIELIRDAWLATRKINLERAISIAQEWFALPYPTFKRLSLFAASHDGCIAPNRWVDWLAAEDGRWLWGVDTHRETMRLLVLQGAQLSPEARAKLEAAILVGPPPTMCRDAIEPERWRALVDRSVWLRLAKLDEGGSPLGEIAFQRFRELSAANPAWRLSGNQREEFLHWMSVTGDPDYENSRDLDIAPRTRGELAKWLKRPAPPGRVSEEWSKICRERPLLSLYALCALSQEKNWPKERWREALQAWTRKGRTPRLWGLAAPLVQSMPDDVLEEIAHAVAWWLQGVSESVSRHDELFFNLCRRALALPHPDSAVTDDPVFRAINHPVGRVTQALLNLWFRRKPKDNDTLPEDLEPLFTQICDTRLEKFRHGRVLLAANLIALFRVDQAWTGENLLPSFDWATNPVEARAVWQGLSMVPAPISTPLDRLQSEVSVHRAPLFGPWKA